MRCQTYFIRRAVKPRPSGHRSIVQLLHYTFCVVLSIKLIQYLFFDILPALKDGEDVKNLCNNVAPPSKFCSLQYFLLLIDTIVKIMRVLSMCNLLAIHTQYVYYLFMDFAER
ncbi:hypothetical protein D6335_15195 [Salmonella enterica subsp. enterica serovar Oslo]|nr:hypothetical protein [Salmonella enterica subsp. enterica serovar Oslo]